VFGSFPKEPKPFLPGMLTHGQGIPVHFKAVRGRAFLNQFGYLTVGSSLFMASAVLYLHSLPSFPADSPLVGVQTRSFRAALGLSCAVGTFSVQHKVEVGNCISKTSVAFKAVKGWTAKPLV